MVESILYNFWIILWRSHLISKKKFERKTAKFTPEYKLVENSEYFDREWYLKQNPILIRKHKDPVTHYLLTGWKGCLNPSAKFDTSVYIFHHPELWEYGVNPLVHYEKYEKYNNYQVCPYSTLPKDGKLSTGGISIVANLLNIYGLGQTSRDIITLIKDTGISYDVRTTYLPGRQTISAAEFEKIKTTRYLHYKTRLLMDTGAGLCDSEYSDIKTVWWEFTSGLLEFSPHMFEGTKGIIAFSDFCYNYFKTLIPDTIKLYKVNYPFNKNWKINKSSKETRQDYHIKSSDFVCLYNFDYRSSFIRKNPDGAIRAFAQALGQQKNAYLIIKTVGYDTFPELAEKLKILAEQLGIQEKIIFVNDYMSRDDVMALINACDVYLSLHRGEGLGLGMLEAMSMGKAVIGTNYGGNTEFMNSNNSCLVNYQMVSAKEYDVPPYKYVKEYAEPNISQAAAYLKELYENPEKRKEIGQKAQSFIETYYNPQTFKQQILEIIKESV